MILKVDIEKITVDHDIQVRESTNTEVINDYAENFDELPAIVVFHDGSTYWLSDGFHRIAAARKNRLSSVVCEVKDGGKREAILYAAKANRQHGLRMTSKDKRRSVGLVLLTEPKWSDRRIAEHVGVGHQLVATVRAEFTNQASAQVDDSSTCEPQKRVGKDGKEYTAPPKASPPVEEVEAEEAPPEEPDWQPADPPAPKKDSNSEAFRKLKSVAKQHNAAMIRAIDSMHELVHNPGTHKKLLGHFESIANLLESWPG